MSEEPKVIHCENEKDWLEERGKLAVTASDAYTLITKPLLHYARKKGLVEGPVQNERMLWGKRLQTAVAEGFSEDTGRPVRLAAPFDIFVHPTFPMVGATPDAIEQYPVQAPGPLEKIEEGPLEIKVTDIEWEEEPPVWYQAQLQCQLSVLGMNMGTLAALHRGNKLIWADLMRHEEFIKRFLSKAEEMSWRLAKNLPPEVGSDGSDETGRALSKMFPRDSGAKVALPVEALGWTEEIAALEAQIAALEEKVNAHKNRLKEAINESSYGVLADGRIWSWKEQVSEVPAKEAYVKRYRVLRLLKGGR